MEKIFAQPLTVGTEETTYTISGPAGFKFSNVSGVINSGISLVFAIAGLGLLVMIISAGFTLLTSAGDAKKTEAGKNRLTYAIVGFVLIFAAYWLVQLLATALGVEDVKSIFQ